MTAHRAGGEAAFHRGCSVWTTVITGGSSCHSDQGGEGTGYWVWRATSQRRKEYGRFGTFHLFICKVFICSKYFPLSYYLLYLSVYLYLRFP